MINQRKIKDQYQATYYSNEGIIVVTLFADTGTEAKRFIKSLFRLVLLDDVDIVLVRPSDKNYNKDLQLDEYSYRARDEVVIRKVDS